MNSQPQDPRWFEVAMNIITAVVVVVMVVILLLGIFYGPATALPSEPPIEQVVDFEPHPSLGVILIYEDDSRFAHAKKGALEYKGKQERETITLYPTLHEIWAITKDGAWYTLVDEPSFYYEAQSGLYISMIAHSWCGCE